MKRRPRLRLLLASAALLLVCEGARAQGAHTLEGRVLMPDGSPPAHSVRVTLTFSGRRVQETFTDVSGRFSFSGLNAGSYQLKAEGLRPKAAAVLPPPETVSAVEFDPEVPERARDLYRQAAKSAAAGKHEQAAGQFRDALDAHPAFYAARLALADQHLKLQQHGEALAAYRKAGQLKPDRPEPYVGVALVNQQRYEEGIRLLRGIVELDKNLAAPYLSLGYAEMMTGELRPAEEHLLRALELAKPPIAHVYLAHVYEQLGQFAKAVEHLSAYLKENPDAPQAPAVRQAVEKLRKKIEK